MIPKWADNLGDVDAAVLNAQRQTVNVPRSGSTGEGIHVGIVDSAWRLPAEVTEGYSVIETEENAFVDSDREETSLHAREVFHRISSMCPDATFHLYQAVRDDGTLPLAAYSDAITSAIDAGVDVLNVSAGDPWPGPIDANPCVVETKRAIDAGTTIVAAAGNANVDRPDDRPPVHCPAALGPVIAVGAMKVSCPADVGSEPEDEVSGPYYCFDDDPDDLVGDGADEGTYCTQRGCVNGEACFTNQSENPWEGNPLPRGNKPDVLAPMLAPQQSDGSYFYGKGTSFAAPLVTGSLASIFGEIRTEGREVPNARSVREAVRSGSSPIAPGDKSKYDAMGTRKALGVL